MSPTSPSLLRADQNLRNNRDKYSGGAQGAERHRTIIPGDTRMSSPRPPVSRVHTNRAHATTRFLEGFLETFCKSRCFLEVFLEGACKGFQDKVLRRVLRRERFIEGA